VINLELIFCDLEQVIWGKPSYPFALYDGGFMDMDLWVMFIP
jgi:hypothetical protein